MNSFIKSLSNALYSENVGKFDVDKIIASYENYFKSGLYLGKSEVELIDMLEDPNLLAKNFSKRLNVEHARPQKISKEQDKNQNKKERIKRSTGAIVLGLILVSLINLIAIPVTLGLLAALLALSAVPVIFVITGISLMVYDIIFVNGYQFALSILTRIAIGIGLIGLSIFILIGVYYLWVLFFKLVAGFYSRMAYLIRRYE